MSMNTGGGSARAREKALPYGGPDPDVLSQRLGDDVLLLHLRTNRIYELNWTAARIWEMVSNDRGLNEILSQMAEEFADNRQQVEDDIRQILHRFREEELLTDYRTEKALNASAHA